eukprot:CAMPEP_0170074452 /NCGR_PEP_ID=MMETSP0019_2-20121128/11749_1 /TAXON_ID=98059 /ORGANISM="Dinobryon sp., Strain UTEXLB2267" /LENGTH=88 /DNA_ID=CAMNT_0010284755 /DNA_START=440 /DNA_END=703 /DNA_ORIENTATION=+
MAMGDLKAALIYGKKFNGAYNYSLQHPLHSEKFTYEYLKMNNVKVIEIPFRFRRTRAKGVIHERDKTVISPLQQYIGYKPHVEGYTTW